MVVLAAIDALVGEDRYLGRSMALLELLLQHQSRADQAEFFLTYTMEHGNQSRSADHCGESEKRHGFIRKARDAV